MEGNGELGRIFSQGKRHDLHDPDNHDGVITHLEPDILQCGRSGLYPCVGKTPWRREQLPTSVFWPAEFHGLYSPWSHKQLDTTEELSLSLSVGILSPPLAFFVVMLPKRHLTSHSRMSGSR